MSIDLNIEDMESSTSTQLQRFKLTEGTHILRILPPFGTNHNNMASQEVNLHWGFIASNGQVKPICCSYKFDGYCPICARAKELEVLAQRAKATGDEEGEKQNNADSQKLRNRRTFLYNAANKEGTVGILELTKTTHDELIKLFKEYISKYDLNPTSLTDGVWFQITREGKSLKTKYFVKFNKTTAKIDGELIEKLDRTPLAENILNNYEKLAIDIHTLYKPTTAADLKKILEGAPVDEIIKKQPKATKPAVTAKPAIIEDDTPPWEVEATPVVTTKAAAPKPTPVVTAAPKPQPKPVVTASEDDWTALLND